MRIRGAAAIAPCASSTRISNDKSGLLDRKSYEPAVLRGWQALQRAVESDGRLGWVQQVGDRPQNVVKEDTQFYGVGAYLLAGSAIYDLYSR